MTAFEPELRGSLKWFENVLVDLRKGSFIDIYMKKGPINDAITGIRRINQEIYGTDPHFEKMLALVMLVIDNLISSRRCSRM